jgi:hypothetical protein
MRTFSLVGGQETIPFPAHELSGAQLRDPHAVIIEPWDLSGWAAEIKEAFARGVSGTMSLARVIARAKAKLRHGEWARLWHTEHMPFGKRKAEMLVAVGKTMGDLNAHDRAHLPLAWHTLYVLAALGRVLIEQLIAEGRIHPRLTLIEAKKLVIEFKPALAQSPTRPRVRLRISRFADFVRTTLPNWSQEHCDLARSELSQLLAEIQSLQTARKS